MAFLNPLDMVAAERNRQVKLLGYDRAHDDGHHNEELARAAAVYATPWLLRRGGNPPDDWPFEDDAYRPGDGVSPTEDRIHDLVRAAALCCAEVERLQRAAAAGG